VRLLVLTHGRAGDLPPGHGSRATFQSGAISPANAQDVVRRWAGAGVTAVASYNDDIAAYVIAAPCVPA